MDILNTLSLKSNRQIKINFDGGDLSSDAGLLLIKEFAAKTGFTRLIKKKFKTNDKSVRFHKDDENLMQMIYQIISAYFEDDCADELTNEPVMGAVLEKESLASQPTLSRFFHRMDETTLEQFNQILRELRKVIYSIKMPEFILFDIDTTLLDAFGAQEGAAPLRRPQLPVGFHAELQIAEQGAPQPLELAAVPGRSVQLPQQLAQGRPKCSAVFLAEPSTDSPPLILGVSKYQTQTRS